MPNQETRSNPRTSTRIQSITALGLQEVIEPLLSYRTQELLVGKQEHPHLLAELKSLFRYHKNIQMRTIKFTGLAKGCS